MEKEDLEKRLRVLEEQLKTKTSRTKVQPKKSRYKKLIVIGLVTIAAIVLLLTLWLGSRKDPVPNTIRKAVAFPVYYPIHTPKGYSYKVGSWEVEDGVVFYILQDGDKSVTIGEQSAPSTPPKLTDMPGFSSLDVSNGTAALGTNAGQSAAIILTRSTLITISADNTNVPSSTVGGLAQDMKSN